MYFHKIKIQNDGIKTIPTHVFIDEKEIHGVRAISFHQSIDQPPIVTLELMAEFNLDEIANLRVYMNEK